MKTFGPVSKGIMIAALLALAAPQAEAIEVFGAQTAATQLDDGLIVQVRARHGGGRGGVHRGETHRGGGTHRHGGMNRNVGAHRNVHRNVNRNVNRNINRNVNRNFSRNVNVNRNINRRGAVWVGRPSWYRWNPGGAIAAGAALGFITAATAAAWAGPPPQAGLCWYYTDPSRRQGFWDVCP